MPESPELLEALRVETEIDGEKARRKMTIARHAIVRVGPELEKHSGLLCEGTILTVIARAGSRPLADFEKALRAGAPALIRRAGEAVIERAEASLKAVAAHYSVDTVSSIVDATYQASWVARHVVLGDAADVAVARAVWSGGTLDDDKFTVRAWPRTHAVDADVDVLLVLMQPRLSEIEQAVLKAVPAELGDVHIKAPSVAWMTVLTIGGAAEDPRMQLQRQQAGGAADDPTMVQVTQKNDNHIQRQGAAYGAPATPAGRTILGQLLGWIGVGPRAGNTHNDDCGIQDQQQQTDTNVQQQQQQDAATNQRQEQNRQEQQTGEKQQQRQQVEQQADTKHQHDHQVQQQQKAFQQQQDDHQQDVNVTVQQQQDHEHQQNNDGQQHDRQNVQQDVQHADGQRQVDQDMHYRDHANTQEDGRGGQRNVDQYDKNGVRQNHQYGPPLDGLMIPGLAVRPFDDAQYATLLQRVDFVSLDATQSVKELLRLREQLVRQGMA